MGEAKLAFTVHHKGRIYPKDSTAEQVGAAVSELGDHVWADGILPDNKSATGGTVGGTPAGRPPVPTLSALPTTATEPVVAEPAAAEPAAEPRKAAGRRAGSGG